MRTQEKRPPTPVIGQQALGSNTQCSPQRLTLNVPGLMTTLPQSTQQALCPAPTRCLTTHMRPLRAAPTPQPDRNRASRLSVA